MPAGVFVVNKKYVVRLTDRERNFLQKLVGRGKAEARRMLYAHVLLKADGLLPGPTSGSRRLKIGPTISVLNESSRSDFDSRIEQVVEELERRAYRHAYAAVLSGGEVTVT